MNRAMMRSLPPSVCSPWLRCRSRGAPRRRRRRSPSSMRASSTVTCCRASRGWRRPAASSPTIWRAPATATRKRRRRVKKDFADTVLAWAAVEFLRFGPMSQIGRPERFDFSPDPRGVTQRQVSATARQARRRGARPGHAGQEERRRAGPLGARGSALRRRATRSPATTRTRATAANWRSSMAQSTHALAREVLAEWDGRRRAGAAA